MRWGIIAVGLFLLSACDDEDRATDPVTTTGSNPWEEIPVEDSPPRFAENAEVQMTENASRGWVLQWPAATDDHGVQEYAILLNNEPHAQLESTSTRYDLRTIPEEASLYTVVAIDGAGQRASLDFTLPAKVGEGVDAMNAGPDGAQPGGRQPGGTARTLSDNGAADFEAPPEDAPPGEPGVVIGELHSAAETDYDCAPISEFLRARRRTLVRCYRGTLEREPVQGTIELSFTLRPGGGITRAVVVHNGTGDATLARCALNTVRRLRFSEGPEAAVRYTFPISFNILP